MNKPGNYFSDKYLMTSESIPTEGVFEIGDVIVNTGANNSEEPFWICIESGSPGQWKAINTKSSIKMISCRNKITITEAVDSVEIGINGFSKNKDTLMVFINDVYVYENIDYIIEGTRIKTLNNKLWNEGLIEDFVFEFVVFTAVFDMDESGMILLEQIPDKGITVNKLENSIQDKLNFATTDLSVYQTINNNNLSTTNKTIVGAINEIFQDVDNGKSLIANAIDDNTITKDSTFQAMSNAIINIKDTMEDMEQDMNASAIDKAALAEAITNRGMITYETDSIEDMIASILKLGKVTDTRLDRTKLLWLDRGIKLPDTRYGLFAEAIGNKIYIVSGAMSYDGFISNCYSFDIETEEFNSIEPIPTPRCYAGSCVLNNEMYCIGGWKTGNWNYGVNECYNPSTNTWSTKATAYERQHANCAATNTKIYYMGGIDGGNITSSNSSYDPLTNTWTSETVMLGPRSGFVCEAVNGLIYCISGKYSTSDGALTDKNEVYDPTTKSWTTKAAASFAQDNANSVVVDNKIYCFGGRNSYQYSWSAQATCYDVLKDEWKTKENATIARSHFGVALVENIIVLMGGLLSGSDITDNVLYFLLRNDK